MCVRHRSADVRALSATLGRAFYEDPIMKWMLPDDRLRAKGLPRMFAILTRRQYLGRGGVEVASNGSDIGAATLWDPPSPPKPSRLDELTLMPAFLWIIPVAGQGGATSRRTHEEGASRGAALVSDGHRERPDRARRRVSGRRCCAHGWTAAMPITLPPTWSRPSRRPCRTTCGSGSRSPARSSCPTAARACGRCGGQAR